MHEWPFVLILLTTLSEIGLEKSYERHIYLLAGLERGYIMKRFGLIYKLMIIYILANLLVFVPINKYIYNNIGSFYTIFQDNSRLFKYDRMPDLSMKGHWINKYLEGNKKNIIMIGDSTVEDFYVKYEDSIGGLLDKKLYGEDGRPNVFNFGSSGTKSVYAMERIKKAAAYKPDLIIWQMGAGSYTEINWVFPHSPESYDLSLGGGLAGAYRNILKMNNENAYFISRELRGNLVPLHRYNEFYAEYIKGLKAKATGTPLPYPNDRHMKVQIGDVKITEKFYGIPFGESTRYFDVIGQVCKHVNEENVPLMIYVAPINQGILAQKYEPGYYEKLLEVIRSQAEPYGVPVLDLNDAVPDGLFIDGGHLKEKGDSIVADKLYDFVIEKFPELKE